MIAAAVGVLGARLRAAARLHQPVHQPPRALADAADDRAGDDHRQRAAAGVRARRAQRPDELPARFVRARARCCSTRCASTPRAPRWWRPRCWPRSFASPSPARRSAPAPTIRSARASPACPSRTSTPSPSASAPPRVAVAGCAMVPLIDVTPGLGPGVHPARLRHRHRRRPRLDGRRAARRRVDRGVGGARGPAHRAVGEEHGELRASRLDPAAARPQGLMGAARR